tara:strand:- start:40 stop:1035 length:996 start_codon:yes stop_codon:yes gene_type:complete
MAKENRTTLKGYFETGDVPNQNQYGDLIDSNLNLSETGIQIAAGTISSSAFISEDNLLVKGHITASGNISASGTVFASSFDNVVATNITASGIISASGTLYGSEAYIRGNITASGNISASGHISCSGLIVGGSEVKLIGGNITTSGTITATGGFIGGVTSTGTGTFANVNTGQGASQVHLMDQNVQTTDAVVFATVDTGQGANELFDMDQNVLTTSTPTFKGATFTKTAESNVTYTEGETIAMENDASTIQIASFPSIAAVADSGTVTSSPAQTVSNSRVRVNSIILGSLQNQDMSVTTFKHTNGTFKFIVTNHSTSAFGGGTIIANFVIL